MKFKISEINKLINGNVVGDPGLYISSFSNLEDAQEGDVTFLSDLKYQKYIKSTKASLIIIPDINIDTEITTISVNDPITAFSKIIELFNPQKKYNNTISKKSEINKSAEIGQNVSISSFCVIHQNVFIGDNCIIEANVFIGQNVTIQENCHIGPNVTIYDNSKIGSHCTIHAGAIIGSDGFGFVPNKNKISKMPQAGKVVIKNNVEIGANTTIDKGTLKNTIIEEGVKLDNLIQIGHNVYIGKNTLIAAQCGIAGSTKIGENCMIGGQVAIAHHINIGNNVKIAGKSGVIKNIPNNQIIQGPLAFNIKDFQKSYIHFKNLSKIVSDLEEIKKNKIVSKNHKK